MKFCVLKKFCLRTFWSTKIMNPKKLGPKSLVEIGPVTAEILLIWTNVTRAYVAWTNVTTQLASFKHGPKILPLKSIVDQLSNLSSSFLWIALQSNLFNENECGIQVLKNTWKIGGRYLPLLICRVTPKKVYLFSGI